MFFLTHSLDSLIINADSLNSEATLNLISSLKGLLGDIDKVILFASHANFKDELSFVNSEFNSNEKEKFFFCDDLEYLFESATVMLTKAVKEYGPLPYRTIYFTSESESLELASRFPFGTVLIKEEILVEDIKRAPDLCIHKWSDLPKVIEGSFIGFLGEVNLVNDTSILPKFKYPAYGHMTKLRNEKLPNSPLYVGGRYFRKSDARQRRHQYTQRLLSSKNNPQLQADSFSHVVDGLLKYIVDENQLTDYKICKVPSRPSSQSDRLGNLLSKVDVSKWKIENILYCQRDYAPQKTVIGISSKEKNVSGAYGVTDVSLITGKDIIIIDDIATTFSTINECARTLLKEGANRVFLLSLAVTVNDPNLYFLNVLKCSCGYPRVMRFNRTNGGAFWACSSPDQSSGFHKALDLNKGFKEIKILDLSNTDDEIGF